MMHSSSHVALSRTFTELIPYQNTSRTEGGWRDGLVTGNGLQGVVWAGSPWNDTMIFQHIEFLMPTADPRTVPPEVTAELEEARQAVIRFDDSWNVHDRKRTFLYRFHPGHPLRLTRRKRTLLAYRRETDYHTGELRVAYRDGDGVWLRETFTSRADDVTITRLTASDTGVGIDIDLSIDDLSGMQKFGREPWGDGGTTGEARMRYRKLSDTACTHLGLVAHYPGFPGSELSEGGYAGITRVVRIGGTAERLFGPDSHEPIQTGDEQNPILRIQGARAVFLITKSARTHAMGSFDDFPSTGRHDLVECLLTETDAVIHRYADTDGGFDYKKALAQHLALHAPLYDAVSLELGEEDEACANEDLIARQQASPALLPTMVSRSYRNGRFAQICCAGHSAPRLCGLWTGEWNPGWAGAYTMDANVNIQVSGMSTGNVPDAAIGYIQFVLRQVPDWKRNAELVYGMRDAILVPVNTDGDRAPMVEYDQEYPFQYWNAGASWMLLPIFELWQCFGNRPIPIGESIRHMYPASEGMNRQTDPIAEDSFLQPNPGSDGARCGAGDPSAPFGFLDLERDVLFPLLTLQASFWAQLVTPEYFTDAHGQARYEAGKQALAEGERYLILPSYSPENKPSGYGSTITANATMDISAALDGLKMVIALEKVLASPGHEERIARWQALRSRLPEYRYDETGALKEWAMREYGENNAHRHISHLYCAWPAYEAQDDPALRHACETAIRNRARENEGKDDTASHGWVHRALVAARLKDATSAVRHLHTLLSSNIQYTSLMTDHNTDRSAGVFCTDTGIGLVGIVNEMLLYSDTGTIELLPAIPADWRTGRVSGLMARTNACVTRLVWDRTAGTVEADIRSDRDQAIRIDCHMAQGEMRVAGVRTMKCGTPVMFKAGETLKVAFRVPTAGQQAHLPPSS